MSDEEKESEYQTILEMLLEMSVGKLIAFLLGFYTVVASVVLFFVYWITRYK
jgi:cell division septal protein FtsQ